MKMLHTLKMRWLLLAMLVVAAIGETIAWQISVKFDWRFEPVPIAAICVGATAAFVALIYDGRE
jgi:hypothetical protein